MGKFPRLTELELVHVESAPEQLEHGKLYVSKRFKTSLHLCACGCGEEVVIPFNIEAFPNLHWSYSDDGTLWPSIGNNQFLCRSHYYVTECRIVWLPPFP